MIGNKRERSEKNDISCFIKPENYDENVFILGIDEAGRGSVVGPMIYCGCVVTLGDYDNLKSTGVMDSKMLTPELREKIAKNLEAIDSCIHFVQIISSETIASTMFGKIGYNLNTISHNAAIKIIKEATFYCKGKLAAVFVDTVGPPDAYESILKGRFPHLKIKVRAKADSLYPIVSAASVFAKITRDRSINPRLLSIEGDEKEKINVGSGYPSDPLAINYVKKNLHRFFGFSSKSQSIYRKKNYSNQDFSTTYPSPKSSSECLDKCSDTFFASCLSPATFIRQSWRPVINFVQDHCIPIYFETEQGNKDILNENSSFSEGADKRAFVIEHIIRLKSTSNINFE